MKKVEAPFPGATPPAAPHEDMTQPMGPLEEGDQALVDAAHKLPAGTHTAESGGVYTHVSKHEGLGREQVSAQTGLPDGTIEQAATLITASPIDAISADISEWPAGKRGGRTVAEAHGNKVGSVLDLQDDRQKAQAIKLETAREIDAARERVQYT